MRIMNTKYEDIHFLHIILQEFLSGKGMKYIVLDDFLDTDFYYHILEEISHSHGRVLWDTKGRQMVYFKWQYLKLLHDFYHSQTLQDFISYFFWKKVSLEFQVGGKGMFPSFLVPLLFRNGTFLRRNTKWSFLDWHTDGPQSKVAGSFLLYLNKDWTDLQQGRLILWKYNSIGEIEPDIYINPIGNRLVLLKCETNISWHMVEPTLQARICLHDQIFFDT